MSGDWLLISFVASLLVACGLGFILFVCWRQDRAAEQRDIAERMARYAEHRPCPWDVKR